MKIAATWLVAASLAAACGESGLAPVDAPSADAPPCRRFLSALPAMLDFGTVGVSQSSAAGTFTISNPAACATGPLVVAIVGTHADAFAIDDSSCTGQGLAVGAMCGVDVRFAPTTYGAKMATLQIEGAGTSLLLPISGAAVTAPHWWLTGSPHTFPPTTVFETSARRRFTIMGITTTSPITTTLAGPHAAQFAIVANTCAGPGPVGPSCYIETVFQPTTAGTKTAWVDISAQGQGFLTAVMSGDGLAIVAWTITPNLVDFMAVPIGQTSAPERFTIANTGMVASSSMPTVSFDGPDPGAFGIVANTCSSMVLPPGGSCYVDLVFHPTSLGAANASLELRDSVLGALSAAMTGSGVTAGTGAAGAAAVSGPP
jgi:hypothetical protein